MQRDLFQPPYLSTFLSFHTALSYGTGMLEACRQHLACGFDLSFQKNVDKSNTACTKIILSFFLGKTCLDREYGLPGWHFPLNLFLQDAKDIALCSTILH